ncbi:magnesium and cobalt efflux protein CorC [Kordia sp. SMS9]|uniref:CNNM domain-containing protein n=1 Tax=Kordia sp. SMS9 TaxID=2282170 RepID=UPI000E0D1020|nr:CNNM domain-containing protein [Kordia sp. SMS9]AXG69103.1 magnesium and cobalt efflux protein CorC [Kordia sp. SMS9]
MTLLIIYGVISIFFSFLCSILEAVLLSVTPTFVNIQKKEGKAFADNLKALKQDVDKPLIAILTLNTIAHTVGAIMVGTEAKKLYGDEDSYGVFIISVIMTILILVASEIIPKTIGAMYWKQLAGFTTRTLDIMVLILKYTGILWILQLFTKIIGSKGHGESILSREDFTTMTQIATDKGVFQESESKVIRNMLGFKDILVKDVMTPRSVLKIDSSDKTIQQFYDENPDLKFSRIPIHGSKSDDISGYFLKDTLMEAIIDGKGSEPLSSIQRELLVTERNLPIPELFEKLIEHREHIALVVDEYGSVSGLVSQEDVIETLLGLEIMDESDNVADLQQLARKSWEKRAKKLGIIEKNNPEE